MFYEITRRLLFLIDPEKAHSFSLFGMRFLPAFIRRFFMPSAPCKVMGIDFPNPVGLAAGMDKDADCVEGFTNLGFGFIEVGTITPKPQPGNPKPRLFRLPKKEALINRMGFNNKGLDYCVSHLKKIKHPCVVGVNIGKNLSTPIEHAVEDYLICMRGVYPYANYIAVNVSSPNTPGLRDLQSEEMLKNLLTQLKAEQTKLAQMYGRYVPLTVKIAPDLEKENIQKIAALLVEQGIDGVIATNTTVLRDDVVGEKHADEKGGLSGRPLKQYTLAVVKELHQALQGKLPIIAVGGIMSGEDAKDMFAAGASLVQIYTGFIYRGPGLIKKIVKAL